MHLFDITLVLILIMDPIGNLASYLRLTKEIEPTRKRMLFVREMLIALAVMLGFNCLGEYIFHFLGLSEITVTLSAGIILFLIGIKILFTSNDNPRANLPAGEPFIFPLAVPLIAGPALLATIMLYARLEPALSTMLIAIFIAWIISFVIFLFAEKIQKILGINGLTACERMIGMILILIAVQRLMEGALLFFAAHPVHVSG